MRSSLLVSCPTRVLSPLPFTTTSSLQLFHQPLLVYLCLSSSNLAMEEDELDPLFAELNMPSHGGGGGGFGNELNETSLGAGFGSTLHDDFDNEEDEDDLHHHEYSGSEDEDAATLASQNNNGGGFTTPSRRRALNGSGGSGGGGGGGNGNSNTASSSRLSLAFELAAATPGRDKSRELMRELGIEEDEEDGEEEVGSYDGSEGEEDERDGRGVNGGVGDGVETPRRRQDASNASTPSRDAGIESGSTTPSTALLFEESNKEDQTDALFKEATLAVESSLATTGTFLAHLRQHTTTEVDLHSTSPTTSTAPPIDSDKAASTDYTDRQPLVESLASSVIKSMYDFAKTRERQVRELADMEREVMRNDVAWQAALGTVDELPPNDDDEVDAPPRLNALNGDSTDLLSPTLPNSSSFDSDLQHSTSSLDDEPPRSPRPPSPTLPLVSLTSITPSIPLSPARLELSNLRSITASLINALSSINEATQMNAAATGEAGRKLRALRGHFEGVKDDLQSCARSEEFVREYEAGGKGRREKGGCAKEAREVVEGVKKELDEGWRKAKEVLAVS